MATNLATEHVIETLGIPRTTLCRWARTGLCGAAGGGRQRIEWRWDQTSIREASIVSALSSARVRWETVTGIMEHLRGLPPEVLANAQAVLVHRGDAAPERLVQLLDARQVLDVAGHLAFGDVLIALPKLPDES